MRFKDLSPRAMEGLWDRWEYVVEKILHDFNEDVFGGNGDIRDNSSYEKPYVAMETKKHSLSIFPIQGNVFVFIAFRGSFKKEYLSLDYTAKGFEQESLIGFDTLDMTKVEQRCRTTEEKLLCLEHALRYFYKKHWSALIR